MKKTTKIFLSIGLLLLLFIIIIQYEVEKKTDSPGREGTIINGNTDSLFIVLDPYFDDEDMNLPIEELLAKYEDVGRLSLEGTASWANIKTGQKVKVWISRVQESYPPIYIAIKLEKI